MSRPEPSAGLSIFHSWSLNRPPHSLPQQANQMPDLLQELTPLAQETGKKKKGRKVIPTQSRRKEQIWVGAHPGLWWGCQVGGIQRITPFSETLHYGLFLEASDPQLHLNFLDRQPKAGVSWRHYQLSSSWSTAFFLA